MENSSKIFQNVGIKTLRLKLLDVFKCIYYVLFWGGVICSDCLILAWWMAVCQGCAPRFHLWLASSLWGSFSISAFKANHVWEWEMIRDGLMLCCAPRKSCLFWHLISTNTNLSGEPQPGLPSTESFLVLGFSFKATWRGGREIFAFFPLSPIPSSLFPPFLFCASCLCSSLSLTPVRSTVTQNQCYLHGDINSGTKSTKRGK